MNARVSLLVLAPAFLLICAAHAQSPLSGDQVLAAFPSNVLAEYSPQPVCDDAGACGLFWFDNHLAPDNNEVDILGAVLSPQGEVRVSPKVLAPLSNPPGELAVGLDQGFAVVWDKKFPDGHISPVLQYYDESLIPQGAPITLPFVKGESFTDPSSYDGFDAMVRTPSGFVFYGDSVDSTPSLAYDAFLYFVDRTGAAIRPRAKVNEGAGTNSNTNSPAGLAVSGDGGLVAVYWRGTSDSSDIYMRRLTANGTPLGSEKLVNTERHTSQALPVVVTTPDGSFLVAWQRSATATGAHDILARRFSASGRPLGKPFQVNNVHSLDQRYPSVSPDARGNYFIAWQSFSPRYDWDIKGRLFRHDGTPVAGEIRLNQVRQFEQEIPLVTFSADGTVIAGWQSASARQKGEEEFVPVVRVFSAPVSP